MIVYDYTSDDDGEIVVEKSAQSRYDKAFTRQREIEGKIAALTGKPELTAKERRDLALLEDRLTRAKDRMAKELERDQDDNARRQNNIDLWRAGEGREDYNANRRKTRPTPNAPRVDRSTMTPEEKKDRDRDQVKASQYRAKKRNAGWSEDQIAEGLVIYMAERIRRRNAERGLKTEHQIMMEAHSFAGMC